MKKYLTCLLCVVVFSLGCNTVKKLVGMGGEKEEVAESHKDPAKKKANPPLEPVKISSKDAINWIIYSLITLTILFAVRYGIKKITKTE